MRPIFPRSLVVKGSFHGENEYNDPNNPDFPLDTGNWLETLSYIELAPLLKINTARCLVAHWDQQAKSGFIVLEDLVLKGVRFLDAMDTLTYAEAAGYIDALACGHAPYWDSPDLEEGGRFGPSSGLAERSRQLRDIVVDNFVKLGVADREEQERRGAASMASKNHLLPRKLQDKQRQVEAIQRMFEVTDTFSRCVVHGDEHLRNFYIDSAGQPGFLDWCGRIEGWPVSIGYFMVNCLDALDRREWERPLLAHYLNRLRAYGVEAPGFEDAWFGYRCGAMFPLLVWAHNRGAWQPETTNAACTVRAAAAVIDLNSFEALGV